MPVTQRASMQVEIDAMRTVARVGCVHVVRLVHEEVIDGFKFPCLKPRPAGADRRSERPLEVE